MSGLYQRRSQSLEGLIDVVVTNIQDGQAPVYDATSQVYTNQTVLTPSDLPSGSSGDVIISDGTGGINSTNKLNVNPANGYITSSYIKLNASSVKLGSGAISGTDTVAIGYQAGFGGNNNSVSIGSGSGITAGNASVSVGNGAIAVDNNSIVINATGSVLLSSEVSSCYIDPLRDITVGTLPVLPFIVHYDGDTKEMFKAVDLQTRNAFVKGYLEVASTASLYGGQLTAGVGGNKIVAGGGNNNLVVDLTNQRVGINNANPQYALDVVGHIRLQSSGADRLIFNNTTVGQDIADIDTIVDGGNGGIWGVRTKVNGGALTEKLRINNVGAIGLFGPNYGTAGQVLTNNASGLPEWMTPTAPPPSAFGVFYLDGIINVPASGCTEVNNLLPHPSFILTGMSILAKQTGSTPQTITLNDAGTYLFSWNIQAQQTSGSSFNEFRLNQNGSMIHYMWYNFSGLEHIVGNFMVNQTATNDTYTFQACYWAGGGTYRLNGFDTRYTQISILRLF